MIMRNIAVALAISVRATGDWNTLCFRGQGGVENGRLGNGSSLRSSNDNMPQRAVDVETY